VRVTIEAIECAGPDRRARRLVFSGPDETRTTSAAVVRILGLESGMDVDPEELSAALHEAESAAASERAMRYLGYRERSVHEVVRRLCDDGYPEAVVHSTASRLVDLALIDDDRFARSWVRSRVAAGFGERRIRRELAERGVAEALIDDALSEEQGGEADELQRALAALGTRRATDRAARERLIRRLVTRGFSFGVATKAAGMRAGVHGDEESGGAD
jgi:regulatory protein